ncbi:MAG: hypothetical protein JF888_06020 [Candidatus Dormibacteraeota bacterium]|uniref:Virginiamycin B lyase n=1 Tax=Candidatus Dormiibacter inghamiae TaxID=3127013 RepID=A0A934NBS4_9BACT|nr:hypothetical protein [Candidatus Dormibacteraeota bacterium]
MAFDPAGNLWLTEYAGNRIDVMRPGGHFQAFSLPGSGKAPTEIVAGPDGAMWFSEDGGDALGRITAEGQVTEIALGGSHLDPIGLTVGPDHRWHSKTWP